MNLLGLFPVLRSLPRSLMLIGCLLGGLTLSGCEQAAETTAVQGTVSYRGKLLDHGSLRFYGASGRPISSVIQSDGTYKIELPAGEYQVSVTSPPTAPANSNPKDDTPPPPSRNALPPRFSQISRSGLSLSVSLQAEPKTWNLELK